MAAAALLTISPAQAQFEIDPFGMAGQRYEIWAGGQATHSGYSIYTGTVWAPFGSIRDDGWRVRSGGGRGLYVYGPADKPITGLSSFTDVMAGYRASFGNITLKGYAGVAGDYHVTDPYDPGNALFGLAVGPKVVLESWVDVTRSLWVAADLDWSKAHQLYSVRLKSGWRAFSLLSLGVEAGQFGNLEGSGRSIAGFARFEWSDGEVSVAGGYTGSSVGTPNTPFAGVNFLMRY